MVNRRWIARVPIQNGGLRWQWRKVGRVLNVSLEVRDNRMCEKGDERVAGRMDQSFRSVFHQFGAFWHSYKEYRHNRLYPYGHRAQVLYMLYLRALDQMWSPRSRHLGIFVSTYFTAWDRRRTVGLPNRSDPPCESFCIFGVWWNAFDEAKPILILRYNSS